MKQLAIKPRLLSRTQAAAYCGVCSETFEAYVKVPPVWLGARRLWDVKALDVWLDGLSGLDDDATTQDAWLERACDSSAKGRQGRPRQG